MAANNITNKNNTHDNNKNGIADNNENDIFATRHYSTVGNGYREKMSSTLHFGIKT